MLKTKISLFIIFALIIGLTGTTGVFIAVNMSKQSKVIKQELIFNLKGETKEYDGIPLELSSISLDDPNSLPKGYSYSYNCSDTITNVGTIYPNPTIIIYDNQGNNVTGYYDCIIQDNGGGLTVTPKPLNIEYQSAKKAYDGTPLNETTYKLSNDTSLVSGHHLSMNYTSSATRIEDGKVKIKAEAKVFDLNGIDVTNNYNISDNLSGSNAPTFEVLGKILTISTKDREKEYDGTPLILQTTDLIVQGLESGDEITIIDPTQITKVGSVDVYLDATKIEITDSDGLSINDKYELEFGTFGILRVTKRKATIRLADIDEVFDNEPHFSHDNEYSATGLVDGHSVICDYDKVFRHAVKNADNTASVKIMNGGEDVTDCYDYSVVDGKVTISPLSVNFIFDSEVTKKYDITNITYTMSSTIIEMNLGSTPIKVKDFYTCDSSDLLITIGNADITTASTNTYSKSTLAIATEEGIETSDLTYNVETLKIIVTNTVSIEISNLDSLSRIYDGTAIADPQIVTNSNGEKTISYSLDGESYVTTKPIDAGHYYIKVETAETDGFDYAYIIEEFDIYKATVQQYTNPTGKTNLVYNGNSQNLVTPGSISNIYGHIEYQINDGEWSTNTPSAIDAGEYTINYKFVLSDNYYPVGGGTLVVEIAKKEVSYTLPQAKTGLVYNQYYQDLITLGTISDGDLLYMVNDDENWDISVPMARDAGEYIVTYRSTLDSNNYTNLPYGSIVVVIDKATAISTAPQAKTGLTYDGTSKVLINAGTVNTGYIEYQLNGGDWSTDIPSAINAGSYIINYRYVLGENYNEIPGGILNAEIVKADIDTSEITFIDATVYYDGNYHTIKASGELPSGVEVSYTGGGTNYNADPYVITATFTGSNYNTKVLNANLTIKKCQVTITSESLVKVYDGTPLATQTDSDGYALSNKYDVVGLPDLIYVKVLVYGEITNVGLEYNSFSYELYWKAGNIELTYDDEKNLDIDEVYGTLVVTKKTMIFQSESLTKEYDGTPLYSTAQINGYDVEYLNSITDVGSVSNIFEVTDSEELNNFDIIYNYGTLTITKKNITVQSESFTKVYDGEEFDDRGANIVTIDDTDYSITYDSSTNIHNVGSCQNKFLLTGINEDNYSITYIYGTLTITPRQLVITAKSFTKVYDGIELELNEFVTTGLIDGDSIDTISFSNNSAITNVGKVDNVITSVEVSSGNDNYNIIINSGTLEVTPRSITVVTNSLTVEHGETLDNDDRKVTILEDLGTLDPTDDLTFTPVEIDVDPSYTGSQLNVFKVSGSVTNYNISFIFGTITFQ